MKTYEPTPRMHELLTAAAEGTLGDEDARELGVLLRSDPAARDFYANYISVHALLHWRHGGIPPLEMPLNEQAIASAPRVTVAWRGIVWAVAASILVALGATAIYFAPQDKPPPTAPPNSIAIVVEQQQTRIESGEGLHVIRMPEHYGALSPILHVVPLQLLAYHTAVARGTDVDKPRNLAKSVTVE